MHSVLNAAIGHTQTKYCTSNSLVPNVYTGLFIHILTRQLIVEGKSLVMVKLGIS
jgi:hypothetical protein